MKCPNCSETLVISDRQGIEIDYCPQCRGVWLDRGELDKILERSQAYERQFDDRGGAQRGRVYDHDDDDRRRQHYPKRKSFWAELFD